jgi:hypothetical protein
VCRLPYKKIQAAEEIHFEEPILFTALEENIPIKQAGFFP